MELEFLRHAAAFEDRCRSAQILEPARRTGTEIARLNLEPGVIRKLGDSRRVGRKYDGGCEAFKVDLVHRRVAGITVTRNGLERRWSPHSHVIHGHLVRIADRGQGAGKHGEAGDGLAALERYRGERWAAQL